ncbi:MAG TPA: hypothetical protein PKC18_16885 [Lacipirellulaceae bacterium]|nr:hypothetical protein [Verrucomicrobiota bacterium]HMO86589.1 hypothetical protein [Lacipirellulaceae bacterium]
MNPDATNQQPKRKRRVFLLALVALLVLAGLFIFRGLLPSHPRFGAIYEAAAFDLNEARHNSVGVFLRKHLPRRVVQSPHFPSRYKDQPRFLDLKGTQLEWSIGGTNTGWLYFWDVGVRPRALRWEFAPCSETTLLGVRELPAEFYGASDSRRVEVFGDESTTNAIKVAVGQILFARQTDKRDTIYMLKLREQDGNKLVVDYCATSP